MASYVHPALNFIRYLLVFGDTPTKEWVNEVLTKMGLAELKTSEFERIQASIKTPPSDYRPWDKSHSPTAKYLHGLGIYSMVFQDAAVTEMAEEILRARKVREVVERLLLGKVSIREIAYRLQSQANIDLTPTAIAEFRHYFWNIERLSQADWIEYFKRDTKGRTGVVPELYEGALLGGPQLAMYRSGIEIKLDRKTTLLEVYKELWFTFQEVRALPLSPKKVEMLATVTRGMVRVDERLDEGDTALQDVLRKFEKFKLIQDKDKVPKIERLVPTGSVSNRGEVLAQEG